MKRIKNKILISAIAGLSSIAAVVAPLATTISTNTTSVLNSGLTAINYQYVTFNTITDVTLTGVTYVKVKSGHTFNTVTKPIATHKNNYRFLGWSTDGTTANIVKDDFEIKAALSVTPVFEQAGVVITGEDVIKSSKTEGYKAEVTSTGSEESTFTWKKSWTPATGSIGEPSLATSLDTKLVLVNVPMDCMGTLVLTATDNTTGQSTTKTITIEAPYTNSDKIWVRGKVKVKVTFPVIGEQTIEDEVWAFFNDITQLNDIGKTQVDLTIYGAYTHEAITPITVPNVDKTKFDDADFSSAITMYVGDKVTSLPDNFMIGKTGTGAWSYKNVTIKFPETSICNEIGNGFLQDCASYDKALTLSNSIKVIGDDFLSGCLIYNKTLTLPNNLAYIGNSFLSGCAQFNNALTIPAAVKHVGLDFMENCDAMKSILTLYADPDAFDQTPSYSFASASSTPAWITEGLKIKSPYANKFKQAFPDRTVEPYRKLTIVPTKFNEATWTEIGVLAELYENGTIDADGIKSYFVKSDGTVLTNLTDLIGQSHSISINGITHTVKVVDLNHDDIVNEQTGTLTGKKALFTFDMSNVICSSASQCKYTSYWEIPGYQPTTNYDYHISCLYRNIAGKPANGWGSENALTMLLKTTPLLKGYIKTVQKWVAKTSNYTPTAYNTKIFQLTATELNFTFAYAKTEGFAYEFYKSNSRAKTLINGTAQSYWLPSPATSAKDDQCAVADNGAIGKSSFGGSRGLSFAFCI